ncbi:MAG: hypothetical protein Q7S65_02885 [Nanoarchaeota archaeon]|nr:hypothetical protein [Nanoarchaeota archaeon]
MGFFGFGKKKQQEEMLDIPPPPPMEGMPAQRQDSHDMPDFGSFPPMGQDTHDFPEMHDLPPLHDDFPPTMHDDFPPMNTQPDQRQPDLSRKSFAELFAPKQESWAPSMSQMSSSPPPMPSMPPPMPPQAPSMQRMASSRPLFVEIGKYREVIKELNTIKKSLRETDAEIKELVTDIEDEERTFTKLNKGLQDVEAKLSDLETCLFVQE